MEIIHEVTTPFSNSNKENGQQSISREEDSDIIDETLIYSFKQLIKKYRKQMGDNTSDLCVASGGLQQYLNRKKVPKSTQNQHAVDDSFFNALPVSDLIVERTLQNYIWRDKLILNHNNCTNQKCYLAKFMVHSFST